MQIIFLLIAAIVYGICAYVSYQEEWRHKWYFIPLATVLGTTVSLIWFWAVKWIDEKNQIYVFSLFWDFVMMSIYYFLPIMFFGVKLNGWSLIGLGLIVCGLMIVKLTN